MKKLIAILLSILALAALLLLPVSAKDGTDGTELQVLTPEQLEIHLGAELAGAEFSLKTDVGMYPGTVVADEDGTLRMEIGGSSAYVLTRLNQSAATPTETAVPEKTDSITDTEAAEPELIESVEPTEPAEVPEVGIEPEETEAATTEPPTQSDNSIPTTHILLFVGGSVLCLAFLSVSFFLKRRNEKRYEDDED